MTEGSSGRKIRRMARIAERIREAVSEIILYELKDPRIGFVTVLEARVTPDVKEATVTISVLGTDAEKRRTMAAIEHSRPYVQRRLGRSLRTRNTPILHFKLDESVQKIRQLEEALGRIRQQRFAEERQRQEPRTPPGGEHENGSPPGPSGESEAHNGA